MAQFIIGNALRDKIEAWPAVRNVIWFVEALFIGAVLLLVRALPVDAASAVGRRFGTALGTRVSKNRDFRENLERAFPERSAGDIDSLLRGAWGNAGALFAEFTKLDVLMGPESRRRVKIAVAGPIEALQGTGKRAIFVTAHQANWEMVGVAIRQLGLRVAAPYSGAANPWLNRLMLTCRAPLGIELLEREESMRPMVKTLSRGDSIALVMDQRVDTGVPVPFFGQDKMTTLVPARLALRYHCELVPVRVERLQGASFIVTFYPPVLPDKVLPDKVLPNEVTPDNTAAEAEEQALQMTRKVNEHFEQWVRERPDQWFPSKRRWAKLRPKGDRIR